MIAALRSEWIKLRTIRMNIVLVVIAVAFPFIVCVLTASLGEVDDITSNDVVGLVTGTSVVTAMLLGVIGAATITGEFGFGTIRVTFAAIPRRTVVIVAKAVVTVAGAMIVEAIVVVVGYGITAAIAESRGATITLSRSEGAKPAIVGVIMFAAIVALLGYGLGLLIRNTPATIAVLILWPLVGEGIIGGVLAAAGVEEPFTWLPYNAGIQMANPDLLDEGFGRVGNGLYFLGVTLVVTSLGAFFTNRRDA